MAASWRKWLWRRFCSARVASAFKRLYNGGHDGARLIGQKYAQLASLFDPS